jgi:hypothetical protein
MQGNSLFELKNELMHLHTTYVAKRSDSGDRIFSVRGKIWTLHDEMTAYVFWAALTSFADLMILNPDVEPSRTRHLAAKRSSSSAEIGSIARQRFGWVVMALLWPALHGTFGLDGSGLRTCRPITFMSPLEVRET